MRASHFLLARQVFYGTSVIGLLLLGLWVRFSTTGLTAVFDFLSHTQSSGAAESHTPWAYSIAGLFAGAVMCTGVLTFARHRYYPQGMPFGAWWLATMAGISAPVLGGLIGHFYA
jgi:hypothetical protein